MEDFIKSELVALEDPDEGIESHAVISRSALLKGGTARALLKRNEVPYLSATKVE